MVAFADPQLRPSEAVVARPIRLEAQKLWSQRSLPERLGVLRRARHLAAERSELLLGALPAHLARNRADSLAAEVLPLLAACEFLERDASSVLRTRKLGRRGRPFWLAGVESTVERVPLGTVLIIGPSNYPLFLPGVQALQALAAGNSVIWKPGLGGEPVARAFASILQDARLPDGLLQVTDDSIASGVSAIRKGVDLIVFTGSGDAGRQVLALAAERATPVIAELSGCDAVFVLPGADPARVTDALSFGIRLNGSATCMAPRRLMLVGSGHQALIERLRERFASMSPVPLSASTLVRLRDLVEDAAAAGATVLGDLRSERVAPVLLLGVSPEMRIAQSDIFAPVLSVLELPNEAVALATDRLCPYGLTAAIFGDEHHARSFAAQLSVGTVLINDLIVPTADPRVPFGGRGASGFGVTRGAEGLLSMTAPRTVLVRRGRDTRHLQPTGPEHEALFTGVVSATHAHGWRARFRGFLGIFNAVRAMRPSSTVSSGQGRSRA